MKARKEAWLAEHAHLETMSEKDENAILGMLESVMCHPAASRLILEGQSEVTLRWKDQITGLACKIRADYWVKPKRYVLDLKSTDDASPDAFARSVYTYGYHRQDALYRAGFAACGETLEHFAIIAVEKEPPYACAVYVLDQDAIVKGFESVRRDIGRLAACIEADEWPSYSDGVEQLSLPHWAA
jgi:exodeoxyribonuclease VIII